MPTDGSTTRVEVFAGCRHIATWALADGGRDLDLVDALAHLQLTANRRGWSVRLHDVDDDLRDLLELVGLASVLDLEPRR